MKSKPDFRDETFILIVNNRVTKLEETALSPVCPHGIQLLSV